ncbi:hypothetical protein BIU97_01805 [Curtobacterium sp. MCBA15_009]|uniref:hypothetical protein n=1 Tax=Curtobacterium sp. MCBA15_009 TaxID=1898737 RepID=UPI0008DE0279|nr:hypothetical protein [Curtobacterium sp. MCBA15_009]OII14210.1 hypothetical protein BIU97_01805 [Curtobacterium sp. MCBA15_009]
MSQSFTQRVSYINNLSTLETMLVDEMGDHNRQAIIQARIDTVRAKNRRSRDNWRRRHGYKTREDYADARD